MSVMVSTAEQINRSPTNQSKAKMLYSFGKGPRFRKNKENQCHQFYEINKCSSSKRATSLGYGNKYDFTKDMPKTPAPGSYQAGGLFIESKNKNKGFGFGSGRGQMEATGLIKKNQNPGPGAYAIPSTRSSIHPSMKGKYKVDNRQQQYVPGPGTYESTTGFNKTGQQFCSKYKNKPACRFNTQDKLKIQNFFVPGPGTYQTKRTELSPQGKYCLSRLQSAKTTKFGKSLKLRQKRCSTPGPGSYRLPSEFGYYINKNTFQSLSQSTLSRNKMNRTQQIR